MAERPLFPRNGFLTFFTFEMVSQHFVQMGIACLFVSRGYDSFQSQVNIFLRYAVCKLQFQLKSNFSIGPCFWRDW